ncbi:hypothetical protein L596_007344 [Steinernema carpocapsae]|uniref:Uncharacterized protein n=1 Tax=Steinernema carpocapsae TaxID=34508 RepID=A0A4U5P900_STECR|nr:hypothetical protein L596_007344 [Steinernema carpocapsae]
MLIVCLHTRQSAVKNNRRWQHFPQITGRDATKSRVRKQIKIEERLPKTRRLRQRVICSFVPTDERPFLAETFNLCEFCLEFGRAVKESGFNAVFSIHTH